MLKLKIGSNNGSDTLTRVTLRPGSISASHHAALGSITVVWNNTTRYVNTLHLSRYNRQKTECCQCCLSAEEKKKKPKKTNIKAQSENFTIQYILLQSFQAQYVIQ